LSTGRQAIFTIESFLKRKTPSVFNIVNDNQQNEGLYGQTLIILNNMERYHKVIGVMMMPKTT